MTNFEAALASSFSFLSMNAERCSINDMPESVKEYKRDFSAGSSHYRCTIRNGKPGGFMIVYFSMGSAHKNGPTLADVLSSIHLDINGIRYNTTLKAFCEEYGYTEENKELGRSIYKAIKKSRSDLLNVLSPSQYKVFINLDNDM